jgi:hypothetical protein
MSENEGSVEGIERKLRALALVLADPAATEHEKANARSLKQRLEERLARLAPEKGADLLFRLGRAVRDLRQSVEPPAPKGDWTDHAFRLGRLFRRGLKK